jgi:hypothetical protein
MRVKDEPAVTAASKTARMTGKDVLTVIDQRTGKEYELPIRYGTYPPVRSQYQLHGFAPSQSL